MTCLRKAGLDGELFSDRGELARALQDPQQRRRCRCQVAAGGDGTVRWMVNQCPRLPLGVFPLGGENLLARHFGVRRHPQRLANGILADNHTRVDLGTVNGQYFTLMASVGLDAEVVDRLHRSRAGHVNKWTYARKITESLREFDFPQFTVEHPDGDYEDVVGHHVFLFNFPEYAMRLPICRRARGDDGLLDLLVCQRPGLLQMSRYLLAMLKGNHYQMPDVIHRRVKRIVVRSAGTAAIQADGDDIGKVPASVEIVPDGLTLVLPRQT